MESAFVLHRRRYRETSLIVEFLTYERGRIAAVARGALRAKSNLSGVLQPLLPLRLEVRGRGELFTLTHAEAAGPALQVSGVRLYSIFYLNELLIRLTVVHDPVPELYDLYAASLHRLAAGADLEPVLRAFESGLLNIIGLGMNLECDAETGETIDPDGIYDYVANHGPTRVAGAGTASSVRGATLLALAGQVAWGIAEGREAKRLMRYVLDHHLDGRPLAARELFSTSRERKT